MHSKGVCHRDLKPRNILFTSKAMHAKISDFSVSKCFRKSNGEFVKMTTHTGTMAFCAPESLLNGEYTYCHMLIIGRK